MHDLYDATSFRRRSAGSMVPATPMYGIPPYGAGMGEVESLLSHLLSLSFEQRLAPRQAGSHVLPGVAERMGVLAMSSRLHVGWAWDKDACKEMVGMHRFAGRWVRVLEAATGLTELRLSTLLLLELLTTGNLITSQERLCIDCLAADRAYEQMP